MSEVAKIIVAVVAVVFMSVMVAESGGNDNNRSYWWTQTEWKGREVKWSTKCFFCLFWTIFANFEKYSLLTNNFCHTKYCRICKKKVSVKTNSKKKCFQREYYGRVSTSTVQIVNFFSLQKNKIKIAYFIATFLFFSIVLIKYHTIKRITNPTTCDRLGKFGQKNKDKKVILFLYLFS